MTKARQATATVAFVDEYGERYQDLFPDVRSFEQFKYLLVGLLAEIKRKTRPSIAKAVGADVQALHHVLAYAPWSVQELRTRLYWLLGSSVLKQVRRDGERFPSPACKYRRVGGWKCCKRKEYLDVST